MKNLKPQTAHLKPEAIPYKMLSQDAFSQWLGIEILECERGRCKVGMTIRNEMLNSMGKAHGGISYALADTAFGFSANTHGKYAVSIDTSINHIEALEEGDYLTAEATLDLQKTKVGFNIVEVKRGEELVALFKGVAYRTGKDWEE
ncbi:PaaI family thioesterase [Cochleicola gelatinilyticus]|uniref:Thioesterase n=1 Tax=Cochleicola gelatinilyticus TaxID=1763537 RepID=A0A167IJ01_9FLAO|nr:hotdog fold thioesterase [Cochleicola gelatinilyticus]OAB79702.1 thioesterase [Cochleicola gelatinilyticus]